MHSGRYNRADNQSQYLPRCDATQARIEGSSSQIDRCNMEAPHEPTEHARPTLNHSAAHPVKRAAHRHTGGRRAIRAAKADQPSHQPGGPHTKAPASMMEAGAFLCSV